MSTSIIGTYVGTSTQISDLVVTAAKLGTGAYALVGSSSGTDASSVTISGIDAAYNSFRIVGSINPSAGVGDALGLRINGNDTGIYFYQAITAEDTTIAAAQDSGSYYLLYDYAGGDFVSIDININNGVGTSKSLNSICGSVEHLETTTGVIGGNLGAITSITLLFRPGTNYDIQVFGGKT